MKKQIMLPALLACLLFSFASCVKTYQCECISTAHGHTANTYTGEHRGTKKQVLSTCRYLGGSAIPEAVTNCKIK